MIAGFIPIISLHADPASPSGAGGAGGTHSYLRELLAALPLRARRCAVLTRRTSPRLPEVQRLSPLASIVRIQIGQLHEIDKRELNGLHQISLSAAREALARLREDVRIIHSAYWNSGRVAMDLARELGVPFVHTTISNGLRRIREGAGLTALDRIEVEREVFARASRIFAVSAREALDLVELYGVERSKVVIVGRPIDTAYRFPAHDQAGLPRDPFAIRSETQG